MTTAADSIVTGRSGIGVRPVLLMILDGWGLETEGAGNAISLAETPNWDRLTVDMPHGTMSASGEAVGLPAGQMGNSEVGHLNLGAGRIVYQDLTRISKSISDGDFFDNPALVGAIDHAMASGGTLHLLGLVSDGGVHSHLSHIVALLELAKRRGLERVAIHAFLDGRDVLPSSAREYLAQLESEAERVGAGHVVTVSGRYYALDRDRRWERVSLAHRAMVRGEESSDAGDGVEAAGGGGEHVPTLDALTGIEASYAAGVTDEFVLPFLPEADRAALIAIGGSPTIRSQDSVIFFNFRPDRAREMCSALSRPDFDGFDRGPEPPLPYLVTMTEYDPTLPVAGVAFPPESLEKHLSQVLSEAGLTHLHIAETEKYAHVTYFFNAGVEEPYPGEERILIPSPKVSTYDLQPEMSAPEVCDRVVEYLSERRVDVVIVNFANPDMVGHTGHVDAAVKAIECIDECIGRITDALFSVDGEGLIVADHGNAEHMMEDGGHDPFTAHTPNPVPLLYLTIHHQGRRLREGGTLADVAPTLLRLLALPQPSEMTGVSLFAE